MTFLAINWGNVGLQIVQLILALSILVVIHEFGHYITARWFKCRVEKFYLFFDPWFSLFKKKVGDTEYGVGWLPLGGYVKISGMVDESMDKEQLKLPPQPWEFRSKPAWQRLIIMLAGVIMNVLLAFVIYAMILFIWGEKKVNNASVKNGIYCADSLLIKAGLQTGDDIISIDGKPVKYFDEIPGRLIISENVVVERGGKQQTITMPHDFLGQLANKKDGRFIEIRKPALVGDLSDKSFDTTYAKLAGLKHFDKIVAIDSVPIQFFDQISAVVTKKKNSTVNIDIERNGEKRSLVSKVYDDGKIGLPYLEPEELDSLGYIKIDTTKYGFFEAFPAGVALTGEKLSGYIAQLKKIFTPGTGGVKNIHGFKKIASIFPTTWDWEGFWSITAFLSIMLAFMNLLPIPALDGGHVLFTLGEMITGRKPNEKFLEYAQITGMIILFALMLYANGNDWFGWGS